MNFITKVLNYLNVPEFLGSVEGFTRAKSEEVKARIEDKISFILSKVVIWAAIFFVSLFFILFVSLTASQYLNDVFESMYIGYGLVALFYLVLLIILFIVKKVESLNNAIRKRSSKVVNSFRELT